MLECKNRKNGILYFDGDVTDPMPHDGILLIPHVVNDIGQMGSGVARALFMKWPLVRSEYLKWFRESPDTFAPGKCQLVEVEESKIYVVNMVGQNGIKGWNNPTPINYEALEECLIELERLATEIEETKRAAVFIDMPRIGCGLAGGDWEEVEPLIVKHVKHQVSVYDWD